MELMKAGEFARFCHTTKETLRHYSALGLLTPVHRAKNGYKLYSPLQLSDYLLISSLQAAGLSLERIGAILDGSEGLHLQKTLAEQIGAIDAQIRVLERKRDVLAAVLARDAALHSWFGEAGGSAGGGTGRGIGGDASVAVGISPQGHRWRIRELEEEYFIETPTPLSLEDESGFLRAVANHMGYCQELGLGAFFQESYRIAKSCAQSGEYARGLYFETRVPRKMDTPRLHVKPAGAYFCWLNAVQVAEVQESADATRFVFEAYDKLREFAAAQGWCLLGDFYDTAYSLYSGDATETLYTEVSVRIG